MDQSILITSATVDDILGIRNVSKLVWIATYPNEEFHITKEDLVARFTFHSKEEEENFIKVRKETIEQDKNSQYFVAKYGNMVVAFCLVRKGEARNELAVLNVIPDFQGNGIGKRLIEKALEWLGDEKEIMLSVTKYNDRAIAFYEKYGFIKTGKEPINSEGILPSGKHIPQIEMVRPILR